MSIESPPWSLLVKDSGSVSNDEPRSNEEYCLDPNFWIRIKDPDHLKIRS